MQAKDYLNQAKECLLGHELFADPFIKAITSLDRFNLTKARLFAELYYPHILRTRLYQANALGICPDEKIQFVLSEILYDEYGLGKIQNSHMQQYRNFMCALDLAIKPAEEYTIIPELEMYISLMEQLTRNGHWLEAVAAVGVASEWPIPKYYNLLLNGLRNIPGLEEKDLQLVTGHVELDVEHSRLIEESILPYLETAENQARFTRGIELNMSSRRVLHAGLYREVFSN